MKDKHTADGQIAETAEVYDFDEDDETGDVLTRLIAEIERILAETRVLDPDVIVPTAE